MLDDPVELVEAMVPDHDPPAFIPVLDADRGAEPLGKLGLEPPDVRVLRAHRPPAAPGLAGPRESADRLLGLPDAQALADDPVRELELNRGRLDAEQRAGVAHVELASLDERPDRLRQVEQPQ